MTQSTDIEVEHAIAAFTRNPSGTGEMDSAEAEILRNDMRRALLAAQGVWKDSNAFRDVHAERVRQIQSEGWTVEHDDEHGLGELAGAAAAYALANDFPVQAAEIFPWDSDWWKPSTRRRNLVKAGALIVAEIERLDRLT